MTVAEAYKDNPANLGSPKMCAVYEQLAGIPVDERVISPTFPPISVTSDGFVIAGGDFHGAWSDYEKNIKALFDHFDDDAELAEKLLTNIEDWRTPESVGE
jgi:hypothetical protein